MSVQKHEDKYFYFAYGIYLSMYIFFQLSRVNQVIGVEIVTSINTFNQLFLLLILAFYLIKNILRNNSNKLLGLFILVACFGCWLAFKSGYLSVVSILYAIFYSYFINFSKLVKVDFFSRLLTLILILLLFKTGIIEEITVMRESGLVRYSMGFQHMNTVGSLLLTLTLDYIYLRFKYFNFHDYLVVLFIILTFNKKIDSRGMLLSVIIALVFTFLFKKRINFFENKHVNRFVISIPLILALLSIFFTVFFSYSKELMVLLDKAFSYRLSFGNTFYRIFGLTFFGQQIDSYELGINEVINGNTIIVLDNLYMSLLLRNGLIFCVIFLLSITYILKKTMILKKYSVSLMVISLSFYGLFEVVPSTLQFNIVLWSIFCNMSGDDWGERN